MNKFEDFLHKISFYFTETAWPDFSKEELEKAVEAYNKRDRKFGLVKNQ